MRFAIIPWGERFLQNKMFDAESTVNKNGLVESYASMKRYFIDCGHEVNTIDLYEDLTSVDYFLFFDWFPEWIYKLMKLGLESRMVYCNAEPPTVRKLNTEEGYKTVSKFFPYIMTWNKDFVDNKRVFWRTIPYNFFVSDNDVPYEQKKLLTSISANKTSDYKDELYTERERLIYYFEEAMPDQFDMYGVGWDVKKHPSYKGRAESKPITYSGYKYALALENTCNVRGYVTEKIFDCLTCGIVPVYYGADDICDYVPADCFIDYRRFMDPKALGEYLLSITKEQYDKYVEAGEKAISSDVLRRTFSGEMYAQNIIDMSLKATRNDFRINRKDRVIIAVKVKKKAIASRIKKAIKGKINGVF